MRKTAIACGIAGLLFFAAAGVLAFWVTPANAQLPAGSSTTSKYTGTIQQILNPAALQQGNLAQAVKRGLPLDISRTVEVQQTSGDTALVQDSAKVTAAGQQLPRQAQHYAVNRTSLEATASHPASWQVDNAKGLTVSFPIPAQQRNYTGWENTTQTATTIRYVKQQQRNGINTYVYQSTVPATPVKNPQVQKLPTSLPVPLLQNAARSGLVSPAQLSSLQRLLPAGAATIPLGYTYQATNTYWVAPATGMVVDAKTSEQQTAGISLHGTVLPVLPVLADSYQGTPSSVQQLVNKASSDSGTLTLFGMTLPIIFAAVGFVLLVAAVVLGLRGRRAAAVR